MYGNILTVPGETAAAGSAAGTATGVLGATTQPEVDGSDRVDAGVPAPDSQWQLWEVFTQEAQGAPHEHAGSVRATDAEHAIQNARDVYARRGAVLSLWVVPTAAIAATSPNDAAPFFDPAADKPYRHPHFYKVPRGVKGV